MQIPLTTTFCLSVWNKLNKILSVTLNDNEAINQTLTPPSAPLVS